MEEEHQSYPLWFSFMPWALNWYMISVGYTTGDVVGSGVKVLGAKDLGKVAYSGLYSPISKMGIAISTLNVLMVLVLRAK